MLCLTQITSLSSLPQITKIPLLKFCRKSPEMWVYILKGLPNYQIFFKVFILTFTESLLCSKNLAIVLSSQLGRWRNSLKGNKLAMFAWLINTRNGIQQLASCCCFHLPGLPLCWWIRCSSFPTCWHVHVYNTCDENYHREVCTVGAEFGGGSDKLCLGGQKNGSQEMWHFRLDLEGQRENEPE